MCLGGLVACAAVRHLPAGPRLREAVEHPVLQATLPVAPPAAAEGQPPEQNLGQQGNLAPTRLNTRTAKPGGAHYSSRNRGSWCGCLCAVCCTKHSSRACLRSMGTFARSRAAVQAVSVC